VGESEDGFTPFEVEIGNVLRRDGENELLVGCAGIEALSENGRKACPPGSFWGHHVVGLWQDVTLIRRPETFIKNTFVCTEIEPASLEVSVSLDSAAPESKQLRLVHELFPWRPDDQNQSPRFVAADFVKAVPDAIQTHRTTTVVKEANLWSPEHPNLYILRSRLINSQEGLVDENTVRFGFREFRVEGDMFLLNGAPRRLRGDSWHYLGTLQQSAQYARLWYRLARETGLNVVRLHAQPYPTSYLDVADEEGMLIISESALWASGLLMSYSQDFWRRYESHLKRLVVRDRNHPSVVLWSIANETFAAHDIDPNDGASDREEIASHLSEAMDSLRILDPTRITYSDGDQDLNGRTSVHGLHYPHILNRHEIRKPVVIGEEGLMHYADPELVASNAGDEVYASREAWLEGIANYITPFFHGYRQWAALIAPFNTVWYALDPLPFEDRPNPSIRQTHSQKRLERIPKFSLTLNPSFDNSLPQWRPNRLYNTIKDLMTPVRFYVDRVTRFYAQQETGLMVVIQNDSSESQDLTLECYFNRELTPAPIFKFGCVLEPTEKRALMMPFAAPASSEIVSATLSFFLSNSGKELFAEDRGIAIFPALDRWPTLIEPEARILYMGKREMASVLPRHVHAERIADASLEGIDILILGPEAIPNYDEVQQIKYRVEHGLRLLAMEPKKILLDAFDVTATPVFSTYSKVSILAPDHPIFEGLSGEFLDHWRPDGVVGTWGFSDCAGRDARILAVSTTGEDVLMEIRQGRGSVIFCGCDLSTCLREEPAACLLLYNILKYLSHFTETRRYPVLAWTEAESQLRSLLLAVGVEDSSFLQSLPSEVSGSVATLIVDASAMKPNEEQLDWISTFADSGGQVLISNLRPETLSYYGRILPAALRISECTAEQLIRSQAHSLLNGISNANLYWIEKESLRPIVHYSISAANIQEPAVALLKVPRIDWRAWCWQHEAVKTSALLQSTLRAEPDQVGLLAYSYGEGSIVICQLIPDNDYAKCRKVFGSLLTNMGSTFRLAR